MFKVLEFLYLPGEISACNCWLPIFSKVAITPEKTEKKSMFLWILEKHEIISVNKIYRRLEVREKGEIKPEGNWKSGVCFPLYSKITKTR